MKLKGIALLGMAIVFMGSCDELMNQFGMSIDGGEYEVELAIVPSAAGEQIYVHELMFTDVDQIMEENEQMGAAISEIKVTSATIEVMDKSVIKNFDAVASLIASLSIDGLTGDTIATCFNNEVGATSLPLNTKNIDVSEYINGGEYAIEMNGVLGSDLTDTLWVKGKLSYEIVLAMSMLDQ